MTAFPKKSFATSKLSFRLAFAMFSCAAVLGNLSPCFARSPKNTDHELVMSDIRYGGRYDRETNFVVLPKALVETCPCDQSKPPVSYQVWSLCNAENQGLGVEDRVAKGVGRVADMASLCLSSATGTVASFSLPGFFVEMLQKFPGAAVKGLNYFGYPAAANILAWGSKIPGLKTAAAMQAFESVKGPVKNFSIAAGGALGALTNFTLGYTLKPLSVAAARGSCRAVFALSNLVSHYARGLPSFIPSLMKTEGKVSGEG